MTNKKLIYLYLSVLVILFYSCAPAYVPNAVNMPLLSNQGEVQVVLNTGSSGFDPQLAFALTDNIGLMLNGSFNNRTSDSTDNYHKHYFGEMGVGYYNKIGTNGRVEAYGGFGIGQFQGDYENNLWKSTSNATLTRYFMQPSIGVTTDIFDGGFSPRFVYVNIQQEGNRDYGIFFEPAFTGKVGYKYVKFIFQFGLSIPAGFNEIEFEYQPIIFSVGIHSKIGKR